LEMGLIGGSLFQIGQVVLSRKGKDAGKWYVVVKIQPEDNRIFVSDGDKFPVSKPKAKNPLHLQGTRWVIEEVAQRIARGEELDKGRLQYLLSHVREK
jgi:ribosomal protein L14E/L6E/L27E